MGLSAGLTRFGYNATDNILCLDDTTYTDTDTIYTLIKEFNQIEQIITDSALRFKSTLRAAGGHLVSVQVRYYDGTTETTLLTFTSGIAVDTEYSGDSNANWTKGGVIRFYAKVAAGGQYWVKDLKICGERSPFI